jgi:N-acetylglucosaminyldiphosphoundecaprenol N-acetyl-beta-D-mannosaminyltransferase
VDALTLDEAAQCVGALIAVGQRAQVVTLNPELVMRARRDTGLAQIIAAARLVTADGAGVGWALRLVGQRIPERVTGVDLSLALATRLAASEGASIFLLGAAPGVAQAAAQALSQRYPGLRIAGCWAGTPRPRDDAEATARIRASGARLALVAYGAPAQELWIARNQPALPGVVALGVGGALDMLAGRIARAPRWMRAAGLEWLYRLAQQPWRWRRMLALPRFALVASGAAALVWLTRSPDAGILALRDPAKAARAHKSRVE